MGVIQKLSENIKRGLRSWLNVMPANPYSIQINEVMDFETNAIRNRIWYRGDGNELEQLYGSVSEYADKYKFWASKCSPGMEMRKIHTGLPSLIVKTLVSVTLADMNDFDFENAAQADVWKHIEAENSFRKNLEAGLRELLFIGDGAFKITMDTDISQYPMLEWYPGERIELVYHRGRINEVVFKTPYKDHGRQYILYEHYGYGYISYELYCGDKPVDMSAIPALKDFIGISFDKSQILAVPIKVFESAKYKNRGGSIFDGKIDSFDALDEVWSQWMDALRAGRSKTYVPEDIIPKDAGNGTLLRANPFDNRFIKTLSSFSENGKSGIEVTQPDIPHDSYIASYVTALDLCLQGIISPSTLGIDVKKLDNAEAQREKEKATLYTRNAIVEALQEQLPKVVASCINAYNIYLGKSLEEIKVDIPFGEYANPSFESQVETISKAKQGGIMSIEASIDELYGDSKEKQWKEAEIQRLKEEQGIAQVEEPLIDEGLTVSDAEPEKLNGAQVSSLMNVIGMVKSGSVTRSEAISIITSTLGISRENAETFIENSEV